MDQPRSLSATRRSTTPGVSRRIVSIMSALNNIVKRRALDIRFDARRARGGGAVRPPASEERALED